MTTKKMKTINITLPKIEGIELKSATVDLEKCVVIAEYGEENAEEDISEMVTDENSARYYLGLDPFEGLFYEKLYALTQLVTIAKAWNSFDEFKPDWEDSNQDKYYPLFKIINGKLESSHAGFARCILDTHSSSFTFKSAERAEQFGKQFIDLFRIVLTN